MIDLSIDKKPKAKVEYEFPLMYYEENLAFTTNKECWAVYKIQGFDYDFRTRDLKFTKLRELTRLFWNIGLETHIRAIPVTSSIRENNEKLKRRAVGPLRVEAIKAIEMETNDLVKYLGDEGNDYDFYLIVKLKKPKNFFATLKEFGQSMYQDPIRVINKWAGLDNPEIYLREVEAYKTFEEQIYKRISKYQKIYRADEYEIQRIIKHLPYFGIGEPELRGNKPAYERHRVDKSKTWIPSGDIIERGGQKVLRPHMRDILTLSEGDFNIRNPRHIEVTQLYKGREVTAYQSYIVVANIPDLVFPGSEWIYDLISSVRFPLNISIRFRPMEPGKALDEVRKKQKSIADQDEHIRDSQSAVPLDLLESADEAVLMEHDMKNRKYPLLFTTIVIGVSARNKEELLERIEEVRATIGEDIQTEVPAGDQWCLFNEMQLGAEQYAADYILRPTPEHLAGAMIGATKQLGDDDGIYIGFTGSLRKPVWLDPWKPSQVNRPPNMYFVGPQGGGKSFAADLIACKAVKLGAKGLWIDPKGDRANWPADLKSFGDQVRVTTFSSSESDKGKLDPYNIMRAGITKENYIERMKEAAGLAMDICMFLLATDRKDPRQRLLLQAVDRVTNSRQHKPAMNRIIDQLFSMGKEAEKDSDLIKANQCKDMAETLNSYRNMAYACLLFGDGDEEAVNLEGQINVLQIQNLVFPREGTEPENFTYQEIIGYACLLGISGFIFRFIMGDKSILKIFVLDESTVIGSTPVGKNLVNKIRRMARALNQPGFFLSQSVEDIGDDKEENNFGYKFAFKSTNKKQNIKVLEAFGLEASKENLEILENLQTGIALFNDLEGRTGIVAIDPIFEEYIRAFDTKPKNETNETYEEIEVMA